MSPTGRMYLHQKKAPWYKPNVRIYVKCKHHSHPQLDYSPGIGFGAEFQDRCCFPDTPTTVKNSRVTSVIQMKTVEAQSEHCPTPTY